MYRCLIAFAETAGVYKNNPEIECRLRLFIRDYDALLAERLNAAPKATPKAPSAMQQLDKQQKSPPQPQQQEPGNPPQSTVPPQPATGAPEQKQPSQSHKPPSDPRVQDPAKPATEPPPGPPQEAPSCKTCR